MKKIIATTLCILGVAVLPVSARPAGRQVTFEYQGPNTLVEPTGKVVANWGIFRTAKPRRGEGLISVKLVDATGQPVAAEVHQGNHILGGAFCGETDRPLRLVNRASVHVHLHVGQGCGGTSVPTQGTVELTFLRR